MEPHLAGRYCNCSSRLTADRRERKSNSMELNNVSTDVVGCEGTFWEQLPSARTAHWICSKSIESMANSSRPKKYKLRGKKIGNNGISEKQWKTEKETEKLFV